MPSATMDGSDPDHTTSPTPPLAARFASLAVIERRLKIFDLFALMAVGLAAAKIADDRGNFGPAFLFSVGAYQVIICGVFLVLVWQKKRLGFIPPIAAPLDAFDNPRLQRWRKYSRRLPFQLDYVLRALVGIALIVWGIWK